MDISLAYLGHIVGTCYTCRWNILGIIWGYLRQILGNYWAYLGNILGIFWVYLGPILGLYWAYFGKILSISRQYFGHILDISWSFKRVQLFAKMAEEETLSSAYNIVSECGGCGTQADGKYFFCHVLEDQEFCLKKMGYNDLKTYKYVRDKEVRKRRRVEKVKL